VAVAFLLFWGVVNVLIRLMPVDEADDFGLPDMTGASAAVIVQYYGGLALGWIMLLFGAFGLATVRPKTILLAGVSIILAGLWLVVVAVTVIAVVGVAEPFEDLVNLFLLVLLQLICGWQEIKVYRRVQQWLPALGDVGPDDRRWVKRRVKDFLKADEDPPRGRIRAVFIDRRFLGWGMRQAMRGQLLDGQALLVVKNFSEAWAVTPEQAQAAQYGRYGGVKFHDAGRWWQMNLTPASMIAWKRWAQVDPTAEDVKRLGRKGSAVAALRTVLEIAPPAVRAAALKALRRFRKDPDASDAARAALSDADPAVRAAAAEACEALRLDGLADQIAPMLADADPSVRAGAAAYIARFPSASLAGALATALQHEQDGKARWHIDKAAKACTDAAANPYAQT